MKQYHKLLNITCAILFLSLTNSTIAQTLTFGTSNPLTVFGASSSIEIVADIPVTNSGNEIASYHVKKRLISGDPNLNNWFCWGPTCYPPTAMQSSVAVQIIDGLSNNTFSTHLDPAMTTGVSDIRYTFFNSANPSDSSIIDVRFEVTPTSTGASVLSPVVANVFPNPASEQINVNYSNLKIANNPTLEVYNMLGSKVYTTRLLSSSGQIEIPTAQLKSGIYFCTIQENNKRIFTSKIAVKH